MSRLARKLDPSRADIPAWCEEALALSRIERVGVQGCFWLVFMSREGRLVHAAGFLPGEPAPLSTLVGKSLEDLVHPEHLEERRAVLNRILEKPETPLLVIDMWRGRETWTVCETECAEDGHCGILGIGYRPCVEQTVPEELDSYRFRRVTDPGPLADLTLGELEILRLLALGHSREEMSHEVHRTLKAVERRRTNLGRKLNQASTHKLTLTALRAGLHRLTEEELESFFENNAAHHRHAESAL